MECIIQACIVLILSGHLINVLNQLLKKINLKILFDFFFN